MRAMHSTIIVNKYKYVVSKLLHVVNNALSTQLVIVDAWVRNVVVMTSYFSSYFLLYIHHPHVLLSQLKQLAFMVSFLLPRHN